MLVVVLLSLQNRLRNSEAQHRKHLTIVNTLALQCGIVSRESSLSRGTCNYSKVSASVSWNLLLGKN